MENLYYTKKELSKGLKKNLFYYKVINENKKRGYDKVIKVYMLSNRDFSPLCIGHSDINSASFKGDKPVANNIIFNIFGYKNNGYDILENNVNVYEIF